MREEAAEGKFSFMKLIKSIALKDVSMAPYERDICKEAAKKRDLSTEDDSLGGYLVPAQFMEELIELKRSATVIRELGARIMEGLVGSPVEIPRQTGSSTGFWVGEGASIPASDPTLGMLSLRPHEAAARTILSARFFRLGFYLPGFFYLICSDFRAFCI